MESVGPTRSYRVRSGLNYGDKPYTLKLPHRRGKDIMRNGGTIGNSPLRIGDITDTNVHDVLAYMESRVHVKYTTGFSVVIPRFSLLIQSCFVRLCKAGIRKVHISFRAEDYHPYSGADIIRSVLTTLGDHARTLSGLLLDFSHESNVIGDGGTAAMNILTGFDSLKSLALRLEYNDISDYGAKSLVRNLEASGLDMLHIWLAGNRISQLGAVALAELKRLPNLEMLVLELSRNYINPRGWRGLVEVENGQRLRVLRITIKEFDFDVDIDKWKVGDVTYGEGYDDDRLGDDVWMLMHKWWLSKQPVAKHPKPFKDMAPAAFF
jgi:hypothetical protein